MSIKQPVAASWGKENYLSNNQLSQPVLALQAWGHIPRSGPPGNLCRSTVWEFLMWSQSQQEARSMPDAAP